MRERRNDIGGSILWATFLLAASLGVGPRCSSTRGSIQKAGASWPSCWRWVIPTCLCLRMLFTGAVVIAGFTVSRTLSRLASSESATRGNLETLRITLNSIGDAVITTDAKGAITGMSPTAEKLTGWNEEAVCAKPLTDIWNVVNTQTSELVVNPVKQALEDGEVASWDSRATLFAKMAPNTRSPVRPRPFATAPAPSAARCWSFGCDRRASHGRGRAGG